MMDEPLDARIERMQSVYSDQRKFFNGSKSYFPSRKVIIDLLEDFKHLIFPGYFDKDTKAGESSDLLLGERLVHIRRLLGNQVYLAIRFDQGDDITEAEACEKAASISEAFMDKLPDISEMLLKDIQALFDGDPAARCTEEVLLCYPGFYAIMVYRLAHELVLLDVPLIPRLMSEYAHGITGIDIGPGATIGEYFFIDHGTGVVIGETTNIGNHVKLYQGVTLGATSTRHGQALAGKKRHPTIEDNVTIYSNASVLGGETVIGAGATIGGSAFVCESVPPNARVSLKNQEVVVKVRDQKPTTPDPIWIARD